MNAKSSARAILTSILLALSLAITSAAQLRAQTKAAAEQLTADNLEDITMLTEGVGTMSRAEFRAWLEGAQPEAPTEEQTAQSFDLITRGAKQANIAVVADGERAYRLGERTLPVLKFFRRTQVRFVVIDSPTPSLESSPGMCVIISTGMIKALGDDTDLLNALVAHELAHELTWRQYVRARQARHFLVTQFLELQCDAVAAYALMLLGMRPDTFARAIAPAVNADPEIAKHNQGVGTHPSLAARLELNRRLAAALRGVPVRTDFDTAALPRGR